MACVIPLTFVAAPAAVVAVALGAGLAGIRINTSPSLPMGLYRITSDPVASLVEFCPPAQYDQSSVARGYRTSGVCPDGGAPLLKPIIARASDVVDISETGIAVNGNLAPHTAPRAVDSRGRKLRPWPAGRYVVAAGMVWVASSYNDYSYDSRYFGPVPTAAILHHLRPVCTLYSYETGVRSSRSR
jgi:conjugative transfer signal peptidase TraF